MFRNIVYVFLIAILPVIELRGAIPAGAALSLPFYYNAAAAIIGNLLPVPFILLFVTKVFDLLEKWRPTAKFVGWLRRKADKHKGKIVKGTGENAEETPEIPSDSTGKMSAATFIGLMLFVLIPCPGTGAWTGSLIASLFHLPKKQSFLAVTLGVLGCAVVMTLASYGVVGFLGFLTK